MTEHRFVKASRYIDSIRSHVKRRYAREYYQHLRDPNPNDPPERGTLSYLAAQAVRMQLDEIMEGRAS